MSLLNAAQQAAVDHEGGPLLVLAGAGSGKTRVLTHRIARLIEQRSARPHEILAVTFTNRAARELRERLEVLLTTVSGAPASALRGMWVGTFHSLCARLLRLEIECLGGPYGRNFVIYDDSEQAAVVRDLLKALAIDDRVHTPRSVLSTISAAKNRGQDAGAFASAARTYQAQQIAEVFSRYQRELARQNALDFDDLLSLAVQVLERDRDVLDRYRARFRHLLVDEYQDTNPTQYRLVSLLAAGYRNLFAVGDVDQSIYSFRAADYRIILQFQQDFPDARVITLTENYRSTAPILEAANALIAHNVERPPKDLWTRQQGGDPILVHAADDDRQEADWVVENLREQVSQGAAWSDVAILYRTNAQSRLFEEALMRWGVPYRLVGGLRFYDRKEVKDALAYLRLVFNPSDDAAFLRAIHVPRRGIGAATLQRLKDLSRAREVSLLQAVWGLDPGMLTARARQGLEAFGRCLRDLTDAAAVLPVSDLLERVLSDTGLLAEVEKDGSPEGRARLENLSELVSVVRQFEETSDETGLEAFLTQIALVSDLDQAADGQAVTLMTLHSAKGLEFPVVYLTGLEDGLFPHRRTFDRPEELEEERRLCYVGITRARARLSLSHAARRMVFGQTQASIPSRFLDELPAGILHHMGSPRNAMKERDVSFRERRSQEYVTWAQDWGMESAGRERPRSGVSRESADPGVMSFRFAVGESVRHASFGLGVVARIIGSGEKACVAVVFPGLGQKILDPRFAPLERVGD
ncbi:MAG: UvrD-helicase domain-containing protein [bacterium]|nr:UvrD-helicase domain-containing protein [bacterium]